MKISSKSAFIAAMALICYTGFAMAQAVSFDSKAGDLSNLVNDLKAGGHGGPGGGFNHVPTPPAPTPHNGGFGQPGHGGNNNPGNHSNPGGFGDHNGPGNNNDHGNNGWDHNGPGNNDHGNNGWDHNGPGNNHNDHNGPGPQPWHPNPQPWNPGPQPWHPNPQPWNPQPQPWHPGPQPTPWNPSWQPHHNGHPDWNNNNWGNNHWNNHGPEHSDWWNNYNGWWNSTAHPYSIYRTICDVTPGVSAKGYIVEQSLPFYGRSTFYYYNAFNTIIGTSNPTNGVFRGGDGTPVMDFYQVPYQADHCFLAITQ